jgi:hypothetical protein
VLAAASGGSGVAASETPDDAAEAFEALRREVARLGALVEASEAPDYSPTLGAIAASLATIEAHPALRLTPADHVAELRSGVEAIQHQSQRELASVLQRLNLAAGDLERLAQGQRTSKAQTRYLAIMTGVGAMLGAVAWVALSGPVARALPSAWNVPERMAAATLELSRWKAGSRLMESADPKLWASMADGLRLELDNQRQLNSCRRVTAPVVKHMRCEITVSIN